MSPLSILHTTQSLHHSIIDEWGLDLKHNELHMVNKLDFKFLKPPRDSDAHPGWLKKKDAEKLSSSRTLICL